MSLRLKRISVILGGLSIVVTAMAQASFVTSDRVAVFYPAGYDASQHQPSPIFEHEPVATQTLPDSWQVCPVFSEDGSRNVATLSVGKNIDLYGTGEVTGSLRRNGKTVHLWNQLLFLRMLLQLQQRLSMDVLHFKKLQFLQV